MKRIFSILSLLAILLLSMPCQAKTIQFKGGGEMYYEDEGEGTPVILVHGYTLDRRMWTGQVEALKDNYRVIVPDLRGYGLSSDPEDGYQFTHMDDILALMDSLGIEKAHVVGLSMGGFIAGDMLGMCPDRLLSCVMVSGITCGSKGPSTPRTSSEKAKLKVSGDKIRKDIAAYKKRRIAVLRGACRIWNDSIKEECTREVMDWKCWNAMNVPTRNFYGVEAWAMLRKNKPEVPSLVIWGDKECTTQSSILKLLPNGKQIVFKNCGHMVNLEYPDLFNSTLLDWLQSQDFPTE